MRWTAERLIAFEDRIAASFARREIKAPVHLAGGNENELIQVFDRHVDREDWVLCSWRSHYHCLLKGVPEPEVEAAILAGRSIGMCFPGHRILSSAIVGGTAPIAVGLALGIKMKAEARKVVCFIGDMTAKCGIVLESMRYAAGHALPVVWVVEDNGQSVLTDTQAAWGADNCPHVVKYTYKMTRPHCGIGTQVIF